jgi:uncharacterized protein
MSPADLSVTGLFSYPVKSCRAVAHTSVRLTTTGLAHDRGWMIVDARATPACFVTQRDCPELATISVVIDDEGTLHLSHAAMGTISAKRVESPEAMRRVKVWSSELVANDLGDEIAAWLSQISGRPHNAARLVRFRLDAHRPCNSYYAGDSGAHTMFADGYPVLIANQASLDDLNLRMRRSPERALPMSRFRPNIVLSGMPAWDEDFIDSVSIGDAVLRLVKPCVRCEITTTDQATGTRISEEPLNTLARFRNNPDLGGVTFGWNAIVIRDGELTVGAPAQVEYRFS